MNTEDPISRLNAALEGRYRVGDDVDGIHQDHRLLSTHVMTAVAATHPTSLTGSDASAARHLRTVRL